MSTYIMEHKPEQKKEQKPKHVEKEPEQKIENKPKNKEPEQLIIEKEPENKPKHVEKEPEKEPKHVEKEPKNKEPEYLKIIEKDPEPGEKVTEIFFEPAPKLNKKFKEFSQKMETVDAPKIIIPKKFDIVKKNDRFCCPFCNKSYKMKKSVYRHIKQNHKEKQEKIEKSHVINYNIPNENHEEYIGSTNHLPKIFKQVYYKIGQGIENSSNKSRDLYITKDLVENLKKEDKQISKCCTEIVEKLANRGDIIGKLMQNVDKPEISLLYIMAENYLSSTGYEPAKIQFEKPQGPKKPGLISRIFSRKKPQKTAKKADKKRLKNTQKNGPTIIKQNSIPNKTEKEKEYDKFYGN